MIAKAPAVSESIRRLHRILLSLDPKRWMQNDNTPEENAVLDKIGTFAQSRPLTQGQIVRWCASVRLLLDQEKKSPFYPQFDARLKVLEASGYNMEKGSK
jgi:hypothetical protein